MTSERDRLIREFQRDRLRLIAYIRSLVGDGDLSEDIFQEVSVVVLQKADEFVQGSDLRAWCRGIARNLVLREREKSQRLRPFSDLQIVELVDVAFLENEGRDLMDARRSLLKRCMDRLAAPSKDLLRLRYSVGLSLREVGLKLGRTEAAVQVGLSRLRKWLSDCVDRRGEPGAGVPG
ncbi:MAG TPA: sigma-70 family RNA polymerase sigma factor [Planctomycetota bacterium]|nr:sigma-70 family RNA polymerase sigma factor [Planctomycetota bacterium]